MKNIYKEQKLSGKWFANKHKLMWTQHVGKDHKEEILVGEFGFLPNEKSADMIFFVYKKQQRGRRTVFAIPRQVLVEAINKGWYREEEQ